MEAAQTEGSAYDQQFEICKNFLANFSRDDEHPYNRQMQEVSNRSSRRIEVSLDDIDEFNEDLAFAVSSNTKRYVEIFSKAVDDLLPDPTVELLNEDVFDVLQKHRQTSIENTDAQVPQLPATLTRRYELSFLPKSSNKSLPIRNIKAEHIGHLVTLRAMVTRVSDVKPLVSVVTYTCEPCGTETYQEVTGKGFMPVAICPMCQTQQQKNKVTMQTRGTKFVKFQEVKLQELPSQVPVGHVPRMITANLHGELTRSCAPGDVVTLAGIYLPTPYTGYRAIKAGLVADTFIEGMHIRKDKESYAQTLLDEEDLEKIQAVSAGSDAYTALATSIAPEIFGHVDVKKALLLQLVGGCDRRLKDGVHVRGDLHVCLMGDPGVAKSQLLKFISGIAPRGVYTTGKGSSEVGLTAAVVKDPFTSEMILEGGALVLADQGICCIDEFDKMDDSDRTAIHEVMEQQTVSIAKAGITTTLNARSAVLAAANPQYGRYNVRRSPAENINMPAALLSRFDLMFLLRDKPSRDADYALAQHVAHVHSTGRPPVNEDRENAFSSEFLRRFVAAARRVLPRVPQELAEYITSAYVNIRAEEAENAKDSHVHFHTTARTLLSILRLSQALARLRFADEITQPDVDEAIRLMFVSKISIQDEEVTKKSVNPFSGIFQIIKDYSVQTGSSVVRMSDIMNRITSKGYRAADLEAVLEEYDSLNVWKVSDDKEQVRFIDV